MTQTLREGSQVPARRRHFLNSGVVLITHVGRQKHEIREAVMADLDTDWILSDTVFT